MTGKHLPVQDEFLLTTCPFGVKMMFLAVSLAFLASTAKALGQSNLPPVTLVPAHPPGHDAYDLDHLVPMFSSRCIFGKVPCRVCTIHRYHNLHHEEIISTLI